jgi:hypothetical protein
MKSADVLDKKRCWKQVVEAQQIINILTSSINRRYRNHPAIKMWVGYTDGLCYYFDMFLQWSKEKHHINTKYTYLLQGRFTLNDFKNIKYPWWLGDENFHRAMRARLIEKDREFYLPLFPEDEGFNNGKYFWPVMDGSKTFRII